MAIHTDSRAPSSGSHSDSKKHYNIDNKSIASWAVVIIFFIIGGVGSMLLIRNSNFVIFVVIGFILASPFWILLTESGAEWFMNKVNDSKLTQSGGVNVSSNTHNDFSGSTEDSDENFRFGVNGTMLAVATYISSMIGGGLLGIWFLAKGRLILSGSIFLISVGWPLVTKHRRAVIGQTPSESRRQNRSSSKTKECVECGWHNHQANNNCVECGAQF